MLPWNNTFQLLRLCPVSAQAASSHTMEHTTSTSCITATTRAVPDSKRGLGHITCDRGKQSLSPLSYLASCSLYVFGVSQGSITRMKSLPLILVMSIVVRSGRRLFLLRYSLGIEVCCRAHRTNSCCSVATLCCVSVNAVHQRLRP